MSADFGSGLEQYGPMHERSGRASKSDLRRRIAALTTRNAELEATVETLRTWVPRLVSDAERAAHKPAPEVKG